MCTCKAEIPSLRQILAQIVRKWYLLSEQRDLLYVHLIVCFMCACDGVCALLVVSMCMYEHECVWMRYVFQCVYI